jgi:hypothetical protein
MPSPRFAIRFSFPCRNNRRHSTDILDPGLYFCRRARSHGHIGVAPRSHPGDAHPIYLNLGLDEAESYGISARLAIRMPLPIVIKRLLRNLILTFWNNAFFFRDDLNLRHCVAEQLVNWSTEGSFHNIEHKI